MDRRRFLKRAAIGAGGLAGAAALGGWAWSSESGSKEKAPAVARRTPATSPAVETVALQSGVKVPRARWLVEENAKPGSLGWVVTGQQTPHAIEGYGSQVSAVPGDEVVLFVNTTAPAFHVEAYRMGYYGGIGGRLVDRTASVAAKPQPAASFDSSTNMVECHWTPSTTIKVTAQWPPGDYLLKLVGDGSGQATAPQQYVYLCVRDDTSTAAYVLQNSVTTWQAYNLWGEYSLYYGQTPSGGSDYDNRSRVVSFDRPYPMTWAQGAADFFGNEFPLLYQMESYGLDMTYWTDLDLHAQPQLLRRHRALFSLGHDEYWSTQMRGGAQSALASGTNLAFLGANACYRQIRMEPSPVGANRRQICYKDASEDPLSGQQDSLVTVNWESPPVNQPESTLIGSMYQSVGADADLVVTDGSAWLFDGCGLRDGQTLPQVVQGEYDRYVPNAVMPSPTNADVFSHSPITNQGSNWSDITYYTVRNGGGVLASGAASFVDKLSNTTAFPTNIVAAAIPGVTGVLLRAMDNVYGTFGEGPASASQPSGSNWTSVYQGASASAGSAQGTTGA